MTKIRKHKLCVVALLCNPITQYAEVRSQVQCHHGQLALGYIRPYINKKEIEKLNIKQPTIEQSIHQRLK